MTPLLRRLAHLPRMSPNRDKALVEIHLVPIARVLMPSTVLESFTPYATI